MYKDKSYLPCDIKKGVGVVLGRDDKAGRAMQAGPRPAGKKCGAG